MTLAEELDMLTAMQDVLEADANVFLASHEESKDKSWSEAFSNTCLAFVAVSKRKERLERIG